MKNVLDKIYLAVNGAVSASTTNVYFLELPDQELLKVLTITFDANTANVNSTADQKEVESIIKVDININHPNNTTTILNLYKPIKTGLYNLVNIDQKFISVQFINDELFYDSNLNVYTANLRFEFSYQSNEF